MDTGFRFWDWLHIWHVPIMVWDGYLATWISKGQGGKHFQYLLTAGRCRLHRAVRLDITSIWLIPRITEARLCFFRGKQGFTHKSSCLCHSVKLFFQPLPMHNVFSFFTSQKTKVQSQFHCCLSSQRPKTLNRMSEVRAPVTREVRISLVAVALQSIVF